MSHGMHKYAESALQYKLADVVLHESHSSVVVAFVIVGEGIFFMFWFFEVFGFFLSFL